MDLGVAQTLAATTGTGDLAGLKKIAAENNPAAMKKVAQQFGSLLMQNLMRQSDGTALPMTGGVGGDIVNQMFAGTVGQAVMSHDRTGLTDMLLHSLQKKQADANGDSGTASTGSAPKLATAGGTPFPLQPYWQGNGTRPLAAAIANGLAQGMARGTVTPGTAMALMTHLNPKLAMAFGAGTAASASGAAAAGATTFQSHPGHASGGASSEDIAAFSQKLMPLLQKAGQQLGVSPKILLAQAAIETGWGRSVVGNNLFGIKAGSSWNGQKVDAATHEYENGALVGITDAFRAYPSAEASVDDFVALVQKSPRYRTALGVGDNAAAYAQGLMSGGWATDINYVHKLSSAAASATVAAAANAVPAAPAPPSPAPAAGDGPGQPVALLPASFTLPAR
ncbi:MAG TPA: glucosaminidase domain-containing protein [Stellaceae bacterium]|nr:glucosaminidase domain-containing protein [Stellaceae bacterium]